MEEKHLKTKKILFSVIKLPSCKLEKDGCSFNSVAESLSFAWEAPGFPQGHWWITTGWGVQVQFHGLYSESHTVFISCYETVLSPWANSTWYLSEQFRLVPLFTLLLLPEMFFQPCLPGKLQVQISFLWYCFPTPWAESTFAAFVFSLNWCYGL